MKYVHMRSICVIKFNIYLIIKSSSCKYWSVIVFKVDKMENWEISGRNRISKALKSTTTHKKKWFNFTTVLYSSKLN